MGFLGLGFGVAVAVAAAHVLFFPQGCGVPILADFEWFHFVWEMKILDLSDHFSAAAGSTSKLHLMSTLMSRAVVC